MDLILRLLNIHHIHVKNSCAESSRTLTTRTSILRPQSLFVQSEATLAPASSHAMMKMKKKNSVSVSGGVVLHLTSDSVCYSYTNIYI